ncbi:hypothetical protein J3R30DRAFT_3523033 [Lentinula aciculospora]|uniref:Uncharacterized protein n=1 Tax=Lentinula aciculospora TaxID=153920 RepID=A0A9W9DJI0_9AGAR|nr:hypothetical protein J3R30DRAFT_3523033 [Lentinula aciculospora]
MDDTPELSTSAWIIRPSKNSTDPLLSTYSYERLLGPNELGFYWDSAYQGTADTLQHAIVEEISQSQSQLNIQCEENVRAAWVTLKTRYPLLGATIEERLAPGTLPRAHVAQDSPSGLSKEQVYFVVDPARLYTSEPPHAHLQEVVFLSCGSEAEIITLTEGIINGFGWRDIQAWGGRELLVHGEPSSSRLLSNTLPACILFIRRTDCPSTFHVIIHVAHLITDGIGNSTLLSEFLDILAFAKNPNSLVDMSADKGALEKRLRLSVSSEGLYQDERPCYSSARRRWHRALGRVLLALRNSNFSGGHTLPRILRPSTACTPAKSSYTSYTFDPAQTTNILRKCKQLGITFGNAHPVLGQLAVTRVLLRRRLRTLFKKQQGMQLSTNEDVDDDEWTYRRRQPMMTGGPVNLRPYLDQDWYAKGGAGNVCLSISYFFFTLPFMPLGEAGDLADGKFVQGILSNDIEMPPFEKMFSRKRFLLRCNSIRKQSSQFFRHPRFLDVHAARIPFRIQRCRTWALVWRKDIARPDVGHDAPIPVVKQPEAEGGAVMAHGGSSFGNSDHLIPPYYPRDITASKSTPILHLVRSTTRLRCRPTELYLGATTVRGQLSLYVFWDENVYKREVVDEWLTEVRRATEWFLCTSAEEDNAQFGMGGVTPSEVVMAKL